MAGLTKCLRRAGLGSHEAAILRGKVRDLRDVEAMEAQEAAVEAVTEYLDDLLSQRSAIVREVEKQGGEAPALPKEVEHAVETRQKQESRVVEHRGVPPGANVPEDKGEIRQGEGRQAGGGRGAGERAAAPEAVVKPETTEAQKAEPEGPEERTLDSLLTDFMRAREMRAQAERSPIRVSFAAELKKLLRRYDEEIGAGGVGVEQGHALANGVERLLLRHAEAREMRHLNEKDRVRGAEWLKERIIRAARTGEVEQKTADFALWLLDKSPNVAEGLGISLRASKEGEIAAGQYNPYTRTAILIKGSGNIYTIIHEIMHHDERMMGDEVRQGIQKAWAHDLAQRVEAYTLAGQPEKAAALVDLATADPASKEARDRVAKYFTEGVLDYADYPLSNPSEYWAVNGSRILQSRYEATSWIAKAKQWLKELIEKAKAVFGLKSDAAVLAGLKQVLSGDGLFVSKKMLGEALLYNAFAGQKSRIAIEPARKRAEQMAQGLAKFERFSPDWFEANEKIRQRTLADYGQGWFVGPEGNLEFEIPDMAAAISEKVPRSEFYPDEIRLGGKTYRWDEVFVNPDVFASYPELRAYSTQPVATALMMQVAGGFDPNSKTFYLAGGQPKDLRKVAGHETQHAIAGLEGWSAGGNLEMFLPETFAATENTAYDAYEEAVKAMVANDPQFNRFTIGRALQVLNEGIGLRSWHMAVLAKVNANPAWQQFVKAHGELEAVRKTKDAAVRSYLSIIDEARARSVEKRMAMSPEERKMTPPWASYDIPWNQLIPGDKDEVAAAIRLNPQTAAQWVIDTVRSHLTSTKQVSFWQKTVGTQQGKAYAMPMTFGPVFRNVREYQAGISSIALDAWSKTPDVIPMVETVGEVIKDVYRAAKRDYPSTDDVALAGEALFAGTLFDKSASPLKGRRWTTAELNAGRMIDPKTGMQGPPVFKPLSPKAIKVYEQALDAISTVVDEVAKSSMYRAQRGMLQMSPDAFQGMALGDAAQMVTDAAKNDIAAWELRKAGLQATQNVQGIKEIDRKIDSREELIKEIQQAESLATRLKERGYFPLQRFGKYWLKITETTPQGKSVQREFHMYEWEYQRNKAMLEMKRDPAYKGMDFTPGIMADQAFKMFEGLSPDVAELFAKYIEIPRVDEITKQVTMVPLDKDATFQAYLAHTVANRSALKNLRHRKGTPGYSKDVVRTIANFVTASARMASSNYHMADAVEAWNNIPQPMGDVKDEAFKLINRFQDPQEEAAGFRNLLFAWNLGGSLAATAVNLGQVPMVSLSHASRYVSMGNAMRLWISPAPKTQEYETTARRAKREGITAPQEIHQFQAHARALVFGAKLPVGMQRNLHRANVIWGQMFSIAEQFNREQTFKIGWQIAKSATPEMIRENPLMKDPYAFAKDFVDQTQFIYGKVARPNWAVGPVGATIFTFTQFKLSYVELVIRTLRTHPRAGAYLLLILFLMAGLEGMPFAENTEDIIDAIGQWMGYGTNSKRFLREQIGAVIGADWAEAMLTGPASAVGLDVSKRFGLGDFIPGTKALVPGTPDRVREALKVVGPAGSMIGDGVEALQNLYKGANKEALVTALPKALRDIAKAYEMADTGEYRNKQGDLLVSDVTAGEIASKATGFNPTRMGRESRIYQIIQQDKNLHQLVEYAIKHRLAKALIEEDSEGFDKAIEDMDRWNEKNPGLPIAFAAKDVEQIVTEMREDRLTRFMKRTPPELRERALEILEAQ